MEQSGRRRDTQIYTGDHCSVCCLFSYLANTYIEIISPRMNKFRMLPEFILPGTVFIIDEYTYYVINYIESNCKLLCIFQSDMLDRTMCNSLIWSPIINGITVDYVVY